MVTKYKVYGASVVLMAAVFAQAGNEEFANFPWIPYDHPAIQYLKQTPNDPVARLQRDLDSGKIKLKYDAKRGYLPDLLKRLDINTDSQVLVFTKTSFQFPLISPTKPRALYFTDNLYVGSVQNGEVLELMALDPKQGEQFYTLDIQPSQQPTFIRRDMACLQCHMSPGALNIPGLLISSSYPGPDGTPASRGAQEITDHRTPLDERWGGWYVTGTAGELQHRGNAVSHNLQFDSSNSQNLTSLQGKFDISTYLEPTSDIVALMTLEHQTRMTNLITRFGWEARIAQAEGKLDAFQERLSFGVDQIVTYMLFADEAKIRDPIVGNSTFTKTFPQRGPRDKKGRSLRDFDLHTRLFRYPLSYMIYGETFDSMPDLVREAVYRRLYDVLAGKDTSPKYARLSAEDRQNVREILLDTKPSLPGYWRTGRN